MKNTFKYVFFGLIILITASCKKDTIEIPESNDPVFTVSGNFDGEAFNIVAGDNGAYMNTMTRIENGVNVFSGIITSENFSIEVGVFDGNLDVVSTGVPTSNIAPIFSSVSTTPIATLSKNVFQNSSNINYIKWMIDGVDKGTSDVAIYEAGKYNVCAEIHFNDGSQKTLCNELILGFNHNATYHLETTLLGNGNIKVHPNNQSNPINSVEWYLNDVLTSFSNTLELNLPAELQKLTAKIHFENGAVKTKSILVNGYNEQKYIEDFSVFETQSEAFTPRDFNVKVIIKKGNETYRSDLANNVSSNLIISDISYFGLNSSGKEVYKITGVLNCKERKVGTTNDSDLKLNFVFGIEIP